ncbi:MAG: hypothetical protein AAGI46_01190 [Planctomycetota bacterium]
MTLFRSLLAVLVVWLVTTQLGCSSGSPSPTASKPLSSDSDRLAEAQQIAAGLREIEQKNYNAAIKLLEPLVDEGTDVAIAYRALRIAKIEQLLAGRDDSESARMVAEDATMSIIAKGRKVLPKDMSLLLDDIQFHAERDLWDVTEARIFEAIALDPSESKLYVMLATNHEDIANFQLESGNRQAFEAEMADAIKAYETAVDLDPDETIARYNLGVLAMSRANAAAVKRNAIPPSEFRAKADELKRYETIERDELKTALSYFIEVEKRTPNDSTVIMALTSVHVRLDSPELAEEFEDRFGKVLSGEQVESYYAK